MNCLKCNDSGLLPFKNKEGTIIPHTFLHCDCHPTYGLDPEPEHYHPVKPEDIDYPVSYSHYRSLCQYHGWQDPGPDRPIEEEAKAQVVEHLRFVEHFHFRPEVKPPAYKGLTA